MWPFNRRKKDDGAGGHTDRRAQVLQPVYTRGDASLTGSEAIFSAVTRISNSCAVARCHLYKGFQLMASDPREALLNHSPSPKYSGYDLLHTWHACCEATGNGYIFKVPGETGRVEALDVLVPERVTPAVDKDTGDVWYCVQPPEGGEMWIHGYHILHIRHITTGGVRGINPVRVLAGSIEYDESIKEFSIEQVKGVNSSVVLQVPAAVSKEKRTSTIKSFMDNYRASRGSLLVLDAGITADILAKSPIDARVLDVERITTNRVARVYNIPPHLLGDYSSASNKSNEAETLEYVMHTIAPRLEQREAEMNRKWLTPAEYNSGWRWISDLDALIRADAKTAAAVDQQHIRNGIHTPNEIRARRHAAPLPEGDALLASKDLAPLTRILRGDIKNG